MLQAIASSLRSGRFKDLRFQYVNAGDPGDTWPGGSFASFLTPDDLVTTTLLRLLTDVGRRFPWEHHNEFQRLRCPIVQKTLV